MLRRLLPDAPTEWHPDSSVWHSATTERFSFRPLQAIAYLGYPAEGLIGGGVSLERPKAMAHAGHISALTNWLMRDASVADTRLV
ncbi:MAG: hypothetical protein ACOYMN_00140 [Roseimicrobium sp.]